MELKNHEFLEETHVILMNNHALCEWEDGAFKSQSTHLDIRKPSGASTKNLYCDSD